MNWCNRVWRYKVECMGKFVEFEDLNVLSIVII